MTKRTRSILLFISGLSFLIAGIMLTDFAVKNSNSQAYVMGLVTIITTVFLLTRLMPLKKDRRK